MNTPGRRPLPPVPDFARLFTDNPRAGQKLKDWLRLLLDSWTGLPARHAPTHMLPRTSSDDFGQDGAGSIDTPSALDIFDTVGAVGDHEPGFAAGNHRHPAGNLNLLAPLLPLGGAVGPDGVLRIADDRLRDLLEAILLDLARLEEMLLAAKDKVPEVLMALPGRRVPQQTTPIEFTGLVRGRVSLHIANDANGVAGILHLRFAATPSTTEWDYKVANDGELFLNPAPGQPLYGVWAGAGAGVARLLEIVRIAP